MNYQTQIHSFKTVDNERLHGVLLTPANKKSDTALIFVHGVAMNFYLPPLLNFDRGTETPTASCASQTALPEIARSVSRRSRLSFRKGFSYDLELVFVHNVADSFLPNHRYLVSIGFEDHFNFVHSPQVLLGIIAEPRNAARVASIVPL